MNSSNFTCFKITWVKICTAIIYIWLNFCTAIIYIWWNYTVWEKPLCHFCMNYIEALHVCMNQHMQYHPHQICEPFLLKGPVLCLMSANLLIFFVDCYIDFFFLNFAIQKAMPVDSMWKSFCIKYVSTHHFDEFLLDSWLLGFVHDQMPWFGMNSMP